MRVSRRGELLSDFFPFLSLYSDMNTVSATFFSHDGVVRTSRKTFNIGVTVK